MSGRMDRRGLQILRTHTTRRALPSQKKHELYLKLTTLEMEKARRTVEREALVKRLAVLDERLAQVTSEQSALLETLRNEHGLEDISTAVPQKAAGSFPIQY